MNRIVFVGLCLVGIMVFVFNTSNAKQKDYTKTEIAKENSNINFE